MATQTSIRVRETVEPGGISEAAAARKYKKYGLTRTTLQGWVNSGRVAVLKAPAFPGDSKLLDDRDIQRCIQQDYRPHRDNVGRRTRRSRMIPEMQAAEAAHPSTRTAVNASSNGVHHAAPTGPVVVLNTREMVDQFYAYQARSHGGKINGPTKTGYDSTIGRFAAHFQTIPFDRKTVLAYVDALTNQHRGGPLSDGSKGGHLKVINTFYRWLRREHGHEVPDLSHSNLADARPNAIPIWPDEIRAALGQARDHSEYTLTLLLAQTGCRIGELCTIRPEFMHDHWVDVWGKPTRNNPTGHRPLCLPDAAYKDLRQEFDAHGQLVMMSQTIGARPLAGPPQPTDPRRAIDWRNPDTFSVDYLDWSVDAVKGQLNRLLVRAGVYRMGMGAHSFRRGYEGEFLQNGGDLLLCRRILGHFNKSDMDHLYLHTNIAQMVDYARKYAPHSFLQEQADQVEMAMDTGNQVEDEDEI